MGKKRREHAPGEPDREPREQYAALPWRRGPQGGLELLLITSRETRRWVIPKGWPIKGLKSAPSAAREAFEEAGVLGRWDRRPAGVFHYHKRLRSGRLQHIRVTVHSLMVVEEAEAWPEMGQRQRAWVSLAEAAELVDEPELKALIMAFDPTRPEA